MIPTYEVIVSNCKRPTHAGCIGMVGMITEEYDFMERHYYKVVATNEGYWMQGAHGIKKVKAWRAGNHAGFLRSELEKYVPELSPIVYT